MRAQVVAHVLLVALSCVSSLRLHGALQPACCPARERSATPLLLAKKGGKKGGGKKGGGKQKQSGFAWASNFELKPFESSALRELAELCVRTHVTRTGKPLHPDLVECSDAPKALWTLPVACLVVGQPAAPPPAPLAEASGESAADADADASVAEAKADAALVYVYANLAAIEALGFADWQSCLGAPAELVGAMPEGKKYEAGYEKKLSQQKPIRLLDASRWALEKAAVSGGKLVSTPVGVSYAWAEWEDADGLVCAPGGKRREPDPTPEELAAAVEAQAAEVRRLKEEEGLTNKDPQVAEAVAELLRLKGLEESLAST